MRKSGVAERPRIDIGTNVEFGRAAPWRLAPCPGRNRGTTFEADIGRTTTFHEGATPTGDANDESTAELLMLTKLP